MLGKLLDGRYQVVQVLGAGGFGQTYLAQDTRRPGNPVCVVKHLKPASRDANFLQTARRLFTSEAETLEKLGHHDQIPRLLAYFEEEREFYLVQDYIDGHPLSVELPPGKRWAENQVIELLQSILPILEFVHSQGVIHRDIKPDNLIRRTSDRQLVLVDFGAVKQVRTPNMAAAAQAQLSAATVAIGTPGYMPTEQAQGRPRPNSDLYSLGVIAIQALTGLMPSQLPDDRHTGEILWQHLTKVSPGLAAVLTRMVCYHFKDRYQTAAEALQALQQLNAPFPATQHPNSPEYPGVGYTNPSERFPTQAPPSNSYPPANSSGQYTIPAASPPPPIAPANLSPTSPQSRLPFIVFTSIAAVTVAVITMAYAIQQRRIDQNLAGNPNNNSGVVTSEESCTVVIPSLNVRSEPGTSNNNVIGRVSKGTTLALTGNQQNGWVEISSPQSGWVFNDSQYVDCPDSVQAVQPSPPKPTPAQPKPVDNGARTLATAAEKYQSGDLNAALAEARSIPSRSSAYRDAQGAIARWQKEWSFAETKFSELEQALNQGRWDDVIAYETDTEFPEQRYWRGRLNELIAIAKQRKAEAEEPEEPTPTPTSTESPSPSPSPSASPSPIEEVPATTESPPAT
ncbi:MAG: protein kinase [Kastovskya adunca ATA6-11-RM4]|jgi:serine/threonine-protein kinase|nr:protein kinase [Kastovskya adunca ATA6-11-RM4]